MPPLRAIITMLCEQEPGTAALVVLLKQLELFPRRHIYEVGDVWLCGLVPLAETGLGGKIPSDSDGI